MSHVIGIALQQYADRLLAPFVTLATIAGSTAVLAAFVGKAEAMDGELPLDEADAHVQGCYYDGLAAGCALAFIPFLVLLVEVVA